MNIQDLQSNIVFTGMFGGSIAAFVLYLLRTVPAKLFSFFQWKFTSQTYIQNDDPLFNIVSNFMEDLNYTKGARKLRFNLERKNKKYTALFSIGFGTHYFIYNKTLFIVSRYEVKETSVFSYTRKEDFFIQVIGSNKVLQEFINDAVGCWNNKDTTKLKIFKHNDEKPFNWSIASVKEPRLINSIILPEKQKQKIVSDIDTFLNSKDYYFERGIPYHRGILFHGKPGCGKTSLVQALASHFQKQLYVLNLSMVTDNGLISLVSSVNPDSILLIEDIDAFQTDRESLSNKDGTNTNKASLSTLLNSLDGIYAQDGLIVIMTTNHIKNLDAALIRFGRIDLVEELTEIKTKTLLIEACERFSNDQNLIENVIQSVELPIAPASLQEKMLLAVNTSPSNVEQKYLTAAE